MPRNLTNYNISNSQRIEASIADSQQEEIKNLEILQKKRDLEENYADEILFNKIAFDSIKKYGSQGLPIVSEGTVVKL